MSTGEVVLLIQAIVIGGAVAAVAWQLHKLRGTMQATSCCGKYRHFLIRRYVNAIPLPGLAATNPPSCCLMWSGRVISR